MAIELDALRGIDLVARQTLTPRDVMLYALGVGLGADPLDEAQLRFVYEDGLQPLPSMAITLTYPPLLAAYAAAGADPARVLHGEQQFRLHGPLPVDAELEGRTRVLGLVDKGPGRGLLVYNRTEVRDRGRDRPVATPDEYADNLRAIFAALSVGGATVIWATTTPIDEAAHNATKASRRYAADVPAYNRIAVELARAAGFRINDLHAALSQAPLGDLLRPDGVHFTADGYARIGALIADALRAAAPPS